MGLKEKLIENIVAPVAFSHSASLLDAVVIKANEVSNTCSIKYENEEGVTVIQNNVPIQLQNVNIIDWFPNEKDHVIVNQKGNDIFIIGPSYGHNYNSVRAKLKLRQDIFSDTSSCTIGGCIF